MGFSGVELVAQDYFGFVCHKMLGTQAILGAELDANAENSVQGLGVTCHRTCHRLPVTSAELAAGSCAGKHKHVISVPLILEERPTHLAFHF